MGQGLSLPPPHLALQQSSAVGLLSPSSQVRLREVKQCARSHSTGRGPTRRASRHTDSLSLTSNAPILPGRATPISEPELCVAGACFPVPRLTLPCVPGPWGGPTKPLRHGH